MPLEIVKGPDGPTRETRPTFTFTGEGGATFRCSIDAGPEVDCPGMEFTPGSPLANGNHTFSVTQYDAQGKAMSTQTRAFSIEAACKPAETPAPQPVIDPGTPNPTQSTADTTPPDTKIRAPKPRRFVALKKAKLRLISTEAGSSFQCKLDKRAFKSCGALTRAAKLKRKLKPRKRPYALRARATDAAGNVDPSAAVVKFRVAVRNHKRVLQVQAPAKKTKR